MLTTTDGIGCSFMLLVADLYRHRIKVQTTKSSTRRWRVITTYESHPEDFPWWSVSAYKAPAVLCGCVIHWLAYYGDHSSPTTWAQGPWER